MTQSDFRRRIDYLRHVIDELHRNNQDIRLSEIRARNDHIINAFEDDVNRSISLGLPAVNTLHPPQI